ncbi:membrane protein [Microbacterium phage Jenos]|nr:membrane protein [Microbacterium phage Jenos]
MSEFDDLITVEMPVRRDRRLDSPSNGFLSGLVGVALALLGLVVSCVALWFIIQFVWWLFLVFLQGAGPSTGNFQDPNYGVFVE